MSVSTENLAEQLRSHIRLAPGESLYGVVDGAQDLELAFEAKCLYGQEIRSLFEGEPAPALADVAPYVVPIDPTSGYLDRWVARWNSNAGILLVTAVDVEILYKHLRHLFILRKEDGQEFFFRFYDPRVLRLTLSKWTALQCMELFGPIRRFALSDAEPDSVLGLCLSAERNIEETHSTLSGES